MPEKKYITGTELGEAILTSLRQINAGKTGRITHVAPSRTAAGEARKASGLSQARFAALMGVSVRTLQEWEQGRRSPSGAAHTLIRVAAAHPGILRELESA